MRVIHVTESDYVGGAARAAYRMHRAIVCCGGDLDTASRMLVRRKITSDPTVEVFQAENCSISRPGRLLGRLRSRVVNRYYRLFRTDNPILHSAAAEQTGLGIALNHSDYDLIHFHWLGNSTLSIEEIGRLKRSVVWTLHDQWAFCGAEHYVCPPPVVDERFAVGYTASSRRQNESGPDLNRAVWLRKRKSWNRPMHIVCPSRWLAECAKKSYLMKDWPIGVIPNPIEVDFWCPVPRETARKALGLKADKQYVLFGACGGAKDPRKGGDLLATSLKHLREFFGGRVETEPELLIFGEGPPPTGSPFPFRTHYFGDVSDDRKLSMLYSAADIMLIPSRLDNLPNTGLEAHACGTPIVAFSVGGLSDIVENGTTGILVQPFETRSFAYAIFSLLNNKGVSHQMRTNSRARAIRLWSPSIVAASYINLYGEILESRISSTGL